MNDYTYTPITPVDYFEHAHPGGWSRKAFVQCYEPAIVQDDEQGIQLRRDRNGIYHVLVGFVEHHYNVGDFKTRKAAMDCYEIMVNMFREEKLRS
jgi:hypothetical protein